MSSMRQTVIAGLSFIGLGNLPSETHRQIVATETPWRVAKCVALTNTGLPFDVFSICYSICMNEVEIVNFDA